MTSKTIALTGAEIRADYSGGTNAWLRNDGTTPVYASTAPGVTAGADGVVSIPAGQAAAIYGACGSVYLLGTGSVQLVGSDYTACPFKTSAQSGGSGADDVARAAIGAHSGNADIHVTADEKAVWNGKADKSEIPTTLPANGGNADTFGGYAPADFINVSATRKLETSINGTLGGTYFCEGSFTPDFPLKADGTEYGHYGLLDVRIYGSICYQTLQFENGIVLHRACVIGSTPWSDWRDIADGGNADTLDGKHASDFPIFHFYDANINADITYIEAKDGNTLFHLQIQTDVDIAKFFKSTDGGASWTELPLGAATNVGAYTEEKLVALEARIAALEGGGT